MRGIALLKVANLSHGRFTFKTTNCAFHYSWTWAQKNA